MTNKIILVGERLEGRSFNGANKALPVLAHALHRAGFSNILQMDLERNDVNVSDIVRESTDASLIAFAGCMTPQWPNLDETIRRVSNRLYELSRHDVPIIVGGYATKGVEDIARLSPWISGFFDGEGEMGIVQIAQAVAKGRFRQERAGIDGLCYVDENAIFRSSIAKRTTNFDSIDQHFNFVHVPERHDMDIFMTANGQSKTAQIFTQRGCPWMCGFCNKSTESGKVVWLSDESFREQLRVLRRQGYRAIYLDVDTFTVNPERAKRQAEILSEEGLIWGSNTRIDRIDREMMQHLVRHGCVYMFCGVEHVLPEVTFAVDKFNGSPEQRWQLAHLYPNQVRRVYCDMVRVGLPSSCFVILGLPKAKFDQSGTVLMGYEATTLEDDLEAVRFGIEDCDPDFFNFNLLRFMPGSVAADGIDHPSYKQVRPSNGRQITAGFFLPRIAAALGYPQPEYHGIFRICESCGPNQPRTTAVDPERIYATIKFCLEIIRRKIQRGGKRTRLFVDDRVLKEKLLQVNEDGSYYLAPLKEFESL